MFGAKREKKIGKILVDANLITEKELNNALSRQKENGERLGKSLTELGYVNEDEIIPYIAEQRHIPFIYLEKYYINSRVTEILPYEIVNNYGVVPIDLIEDILTVAIADIPTEDVIKKIEGVTGLKVKAVMITKGDFKRYIKGAYNLSVVDKDKESSETGTATYVDTPDYRGNERRRYPRLNHKLKVKYEFREELNINSSLNISRGGVLIKTKSPVPESTNIILRLELPTRHDDIIVIARVVRVEKMADSDSYLVALSFSSMDAADNKALVSFIASFTK